MLPKTTYNTASHSTIRFSCLRFGSSSPPFVMATSRAVRAVICPSMLSSDFSSLAAEAKRMIDAGADWLHMDVMVSGVRFPMSMSLCCGCVGLLCFGSVLGRVL